MSALRGMETEAQFGQLDTVVNRTAFFPRTRKPVPQTDGARTQYIMFL